MKILGILTGWRAARKKGSDSGGGGGLNWTMLLKMNISSELDFFKIMVHIFFFIRQFRTFHDNSSNPCCRVEN